ncbi:hypothetical protein PtA15_13A499 [Puccinia triticina]|uniref:mRNA-decapping enzyme C-terminal domain-containing protein n=1 Tax=Puccinia triticina TaxID=208348 RepID=A0ABY7D1U8_9BASI|nr:uncharacterized protein PtA15_13A499 [Puccinia triticina]WAQ91098.1 hypothetical protein PtA15_13A499 [Puccinia triticina]
MSHANFPAPGNPPSTIPLPPNHPSPNPMDPRTINFNVLRRHDPQISSIRDSTSYAVIYRYFHGAWSKTGFEGTLFIFQRDTHPFYGVFVLNRQGLDNLCEGLLPGWDVDLDEGLIIWRSAGATGDADDDVIYGIWVYEEKDRTRIATTMQELIETASAQQNPQPPPPSSSPPPVSLSHPVPRVPIITAGQTISLDQLFGVGSVCSEPPPQTSALPHPGASVTDPDEEKENLLPSQVMSPDPSDLPKGMQLLDSLFQKAAIKPQPASHQSNPNTDPEPINQHPTSIHQLLNQLSGSSSKPPSQNTSSHQQSQSTNNNRRDRRQSSGQENFKHQSTTVDQPSHRPINQNHSSTRADHRNLNPSHNHPHSRRSSGGSSSHSRNGKIPFGLNPATQPHTQQPAAPTNPVNIVAAPVPMDSANAEARHNILSLLGHPAAARPDDVYSTGTNPTLVAPPSGTNNHTTGWPHSSPDSRGGGSNPRILYSPQQQQLPQQQGTGSHAYNSPRSTHVSQEASPHQHSQQAFVQHNPLPLPSSYGTSAERTPPRGAQLSNSANHSPNGPRPPPHHHQHSQPPPGAGAQPPVQSNGGAAGPVFSGSVWPFDKLPNRALSPLNPARQSPASLAIHRARGAAPAGHPQTTTNGTQRKTFPHHHQQQQARHHHHHSPAGHSPPLVNDSSRPSRAHSLTDPTTASTTHHSPSSTHHNAGPPTLVNSKLAVESLDQLLLGHNLDNHQPSHRQQQVADANPLDKAHFVNSILDLINNNGAFVDTLYARYLARYAEKYL